MSPKQTKSPEKSKGEGDSGEVVAGTNGDKQTSGNTSSSGSSRDKKATKGAKTKSKFFGNEDKKGKNKKPTSESLQSTETGEQTTSAKPRALVDELKLFQNNNLLNQEDPIHNLHKQLNELINNESDDGNHRKQQQHQSDRVATKKKKQQQQQQPATDEKMNSTPRQSATAINLTQSNGDSSKLANSMDAAATTKSDPNQLTSSSLSSTSKSPPLVASKSHTKNDNICAEQQQQTRRTISPMSANYVNNANGDTKTAITSMMKSTANSDDNSENVSTIKKGVLWQHQQGLFNRWKKRYFILTTDYLVCFKRSTPKVGRSEMGKFLYKISLGEIAQLQWAKPKKSDKGAIILYTTRHENLFLWTKENLDEWMFLINESIQRHKDKKSYLLIQQQQVKGSKFPSIATSQIAFSQKLANDKQSMCNNDASQIICEEFYENMVKNTQVGGPQRLGNEIHSAGESKSTSSLVNGGHIKESDKSKLEEVKRKSFHAQASEDQRSQQNERIETAQGKDNETADFLTSNAIRSQARKTGNPVASSEKANSIERERNQADTINTAGSSNEKSKHSPSGGGGGSSQAHNAGMEAGADPASEIMIYDPSSLGEPKQRHKGSDTDSSLVSPHKPESDDSPSSPSRASAPKTTSMMTSGESKEGANLSSLAGLSSSQASPSRKYPKADLGEETGTNISARHTKGFLGEGDAHDASATSSTLSREEDKTDPSVTSGGLKKQLEGGSLDSGGRVKSMKSGEPDAPPVRDIISEGGETSSSVLSEASNLRSADEFTANCDIKKQNSIEQTVSSVTNGKSSEARTSQSGPQLSLIRRDDSWQSLVSLTRIGKATPAMQVAQRSLYAQHIMPDSVAAGGRPKPADRHLINIESTITPVRLGPNSLQQQHNYHQQQQFLRQQSIGVANERKFRPLPPIDQYQAASFHVPLGTSDNNNNNLVGPTNQKPTTSYQQKLLQLQLLHNSNNVDYIRNNNGYESTDYYGVYGPSDVAFSNHYGYYSMRSNLKSATSEFSFIRPSSSGFGNLSNCNNISTGTNRSALQHHQLQQQQQQLIENHDTHNGVPSSSSKAMLMRPVPNELFRDGNNNDIRQASRALPTSARERQSAKFMDDSVRLGNEQMIVNGQIVNGGLLTQDMALGPPNRELPLKPNKKRHDVEMGVMGQGHLPKSSSLTSNLVCFLKRAFSRRSKKNKASGRKSRSAKLAESCSSSLGAFDDHHPTGSRFVPIAPSAFSTGSKSVDGRQPLIVGQPTNNLIQSNQGTVDTMEASQHPAREDTIDPNAMPRSIHGHPQMLAQQQPTPRLPVCHPIRQVGQFGGSPLHKSNSISTTIGIARYDHNENNLHTGPLSSENEIHNSPVIPRSAKVMSAHLTPLMLQRERVSSPSALQTNAQQQQQQQQQFLMSPRNSRADQLPRPSSIYGQPSMISSPSINRDELLARGGHHFGLHRSSVHGQPTASYRDRSPHQQNLMLSSDGRRPNHTIIMPFNLDTTREVCEDIPSPTTEGLARFNSNSGQVSNRQEMPSLAKRDAILRSPSMNSSGGSRLNQRRAIVNPMLQSSTMDTIYDNHPMLTRSEDRGVCKQDTAANLRSESISYSHYDNHNQFIMEKLELQQQQNNSPHYQKRQHLLTTGSCDMPQSSPMIIQNQVDRSQNKIPSQFYTPSHQRSTVFDMVAQNEIPSALVAPSTPVYGGTRVSYLEFNGGQRRPFMDSPPVQRGNPNQSSPSAAPLHHLTRSPMLPRRNLEQHYQQSPLLNGQSTRVVNRGDGVQATIIGDRQRDNGFATAHGSAQPVINIAGAPGVNLDPSLAASLLQGTNINAYESLTRDQLSGRAKPTNSKAFLVSTRLCMASHGHSGSSNENSSASPTAMAASVCKEVDSHEVNNNCSSNSGKNDSTQHDRIGSDGTGCARPHQLDKSSKGGSKREAVGRVSYGRRASSSGSSSSESHSSRKSSATNISSSTSSTKSTSTSTSQPSSGRQARNDSMSQKSERNWITSKLAQ